MYPEMTVQVDTDNYTDVLAYNNGSMLLEFEQVLDPPVESVTDVELIAYDLPCQKDTVDASNDCIDFQVGPFIAQCAITDSGLGYDMFNPPNIHVTHHRSFNTSDTESNGDVGTPGWYPPFAARSISGIRIVHAEQGDMSPVVSDTVWNASISQKPLINAEDSFRMGCHVENTKLSGASMHIYSRGTVLEASKCRCVVDKPFEYPYSLYISTGDSFLFTDMIKIYRAFYRYEMSGANDIKILGRQVAMEINYALGWDVRYELNDGLCPEDSTHRWKVEHRGQSLHIAGTWQQDPRWAPRYMCLFQAHETEEHRFFFVDTQDKYFELGKVLNGAVPPPLQWADKTYHNNDEVSSSEYTQHFVTGAVNGHGQTCITTLWGLLGFISPVQAKKALPAPFAIVGLQLPGVQANVKGYTSLINASTNLQAYFNMYLTRKKATLSLSVLKCTARLRHGVYSVGSVMEQSHRLPAANGSEHHSTHIQTRQAADGLIKEVQDQMNIAYQGYRIERPLGNTSDIVESHEGREWRLHVPHMGQEKSPHMFCVSLENSDIQQPFQNQSGTNLRSNQVRRTRIRIVMSEMYNAMRPEDNKHNMTMSLLFKTGPNASRSAGSMLGFERADYTDEKFVVFRPVDLGSSYAPQTASSVMYGIQAPSRWDTGLKSKACVIEMGINSKLYNPVAVAMVAGRNDFATQASNGDGSTQTFINESLRLSGFNRHAEIGADTSKLSMFSDARALSVIAPFMRHVHQDNPNTPVFRGIDWGAKKMSLDKRNYVERLCIRAVDGQTGDVWKCNASEPVFLMFRLHHSRESKDSFRRQS